MPMDTNLIAATVGIFAGAVGYWVATFWMRPILRYKEIRSKVLSDFILYAQVTNADGLNDRMKELYEERVFQIRRSAADLAACLMELPHWYTCYLCLRGLSPKKAVTDLIGHSNTREHDAADERVQRIKKSLGLKTEMV